MKTRGFVIRNFRNIGVCEGDKSQEAFLRLSNTDENIGGLVIILGENNSGKSNLLDALAKFGNCENNPLSDKDIPNFPQHRNCLPAISFSYQIPAYYLYYPQDVANRSGEAQKIRAKGQQVDFDALLKKLQNQFDSLNVYIEHCKNEEYDMKLILQEEETELGRFLRCTTEPFKTRDDFLPPGKIRVGKSERLHCPLIVGYEALDVKQNLAAYLDKQTQHIESQSVKKYCTTVSLDEDKKMQQKYAIGNVVKDGECVSLLDVQDSEIPNQNVKKLLERKIVLYEELSFKDDELSTTPDKLADSKFFQTLFHGIYGEDGHLVIKSIQGAYEQQDEIGELSEIEDSINDKLQDMNQYFNSIYEVSVSGTYHFEIRFDIHKILLQIRRNRQRLSLERQSASFKKMFGFFFQLIYDKKIQNGTIVLIDDIEESLSVPMQRRLRKYLKELAQKRGILFIVSTHSPFMIDCNHLDEIRLLKARDNGLGTEIVDLANADGTIKENELDYIADIVGVNYRDSLRIASKNAT